MTHVAVLYACVVVQVLACHVQQLQSLDKQDWDSDLPMLPATAAAIFASPASSARADALTASPQEWSGRTVLRLLVQLAAPCVRLPVDAHGFVPRCVALVLAGASSTAANGGAYEQGPHAWEASFSHVSPVVRVLLALRQVLFWGVCVLCVFVIVMDAVLG